METKKTLVFMSVVNALATVLPADRFVGRLGVPFVSFRQVTLSSTQHRRKEIAIRKVLGTDSREIVWIFFKEYISQVVVAGLFALPIAYLIMKNWLQEECTTHNTSLNK